MTVIRDSRADAPHDNVLKQAIALLRQHPRAYLVTNLVYYGLVLVGAMMVFAIPALQELMMVSIEQSFGEGGALAPVTEAYLNEEVLTAIGLTFGVNLVLGSLAYITLPSLIIPFSGLLLGLFRAMLWGFIFSPASVGGVTAADILLGAGIVLLLLLEGQGYVLAMFAAYLHGRSVVFPRRVGAQTIWQGWLHGLKQTALVYILVVLALFVAAVYEVALAVFMLG